MTRATEVAITSPGLDPMQVWRVMATLIKAPEQYRFTVSETNINADLNQGLCALLDLDHANGALIPESGCDDYCQPDCSGAWCWSPARYITVRMDTAYAATDSCGCHSGGIHLRLLHGLGRWLDQRGAVYQWRDESGEGWRHGADWGTLGDPREACPSHRSLPPPVAVVHA